MEIARGTLQFARTSLSTCTPLTLALPLSHTDTHTRYFLAGAVEAGEFLPHSHTETLPFSLYRCVHACVYVSDDLYLCISSGANPPLQTPFPVEDHYLTSRYFILFPPSLCYYYTFILIPCVPSLFSLILICTSHLSFSSSLLTLALLSTSLHSSRPEKTEQLQIIAIPRHSHSPSCFAMPETFGIFCFFITDSVTVQSVQLESKVD